MNRRHFLRSVAGAVLALGLPLPLVARRIAEPEVEAIEVYRISTIGPGGRYASFAEWEADTGGDLVAEGRVEIAELRDGGSWHAYDINPATREGVVLSFRPARG